MSSWPTKVPFFFFFFIPWAKQTHLSPSGELPQRWWQCHHRSSHWPSWNCSRRNQPQQCSNRWGTVLDRSHRLLKSWSAQHSSPVLCAIRPSTDTTTCRYHMTIKIATTSTNIHSWILIYYYYCPPPPPPPSCIVQWQNQDLLHMVLLLHGVEMFNPTI